MARPTIPSVQSALSASRSSRSFVVGTAGHVDHGKSTLVKALTGIDPDRLAEEKAREMTIDLGFAWLTLPGGSSVSIIDVPGHERFIKNMLAGVGGIDAALLVIAADEGPMPQTFEHLAILDLLQIEHGVVAITKRDNVDQDWLDLVIEEVRERIDGSSLACAPIVPVSALTGAGLADLIASLERILESADPWRPNGAPRLPVDRVFSVSGFGTVVTGTLSGGSLTVGDELQIYPFQRRARVRGLQTHQEKVTVAPPGLRTAVNLAGASNEDVSRGDVLAPPGALTPSQRLDVRLHLLPKAPLILKQNDRVDFYSGASEVAARVTLLDRETVEPGETAWVQLRLSAPVVVLKHDRFIVRRSSPSETIGGGEIIDPSPMPHRRFRPETVAALEILAAGRLDELVLQRLQRDPAELNELQMSFPGMSPESVVAAVDDLFARGLAVSLGPKSGELTASGTIAEATWYEVTSNRLAVVLRTFHDNQPLRLGIPREELRTRLDLSKPRVFDALVETAQRDDIVIDNGATLRLPDFRLSLDPERRQRADSWLAAMATAPFSPPGPQEFNIDVESLTVLENLGEIQKVANAVYFTPVAWRTLVDGTLDAIDREGAINLAQFRDHFGTSRKFAQAALEHLDAVRYTKRVGDDRVRGSRYPDWVRKS